MKFGRSNNPMFGQKAIAKAKALDHELYGGNNRGDILQEHMTVSGAVNKTLVLTLVLLVSALFSYIAPMSIYMPVGALGAGAVYMFTSFKPNYAPITAPIFALLEGLFVGTVSFIYAAQFEGIIFQALTATIGVLLTMLMVYKSGLMLLDFDNFDKGEAAEAPKFMEWYYGMGLLFTLVWLYVEFLRLLSKLRD